MCNFSSSTLILEGVKRVWGKDGYLPQKEATAPLVDEPSAAVHPPASRRQQRKEPQPDSSTQNQDKQQLAFTSLFVVLGVGELNVSGEKNYL